MPLVAVAPRPACATPSEIDRRSRHLASGLRSGGLLRTAVVVLCCPAHAEERRVALLAGERSGRPTLSVDPPLWDPADLRRLGRELDGPLVLACPEGVEAWRGSRARGLVVGEDGGAGVVWWRLVELHGRARLDVRRKAAAC
jgi:hypothetical protein